MKETYTIPENERAKIEKLVRRYEKKAATYEVPLTVTFGDKYGKRFPIMAKDHEHHVMVNTGRTAIYEVFDLTIESEIIRKDGYQVIARLEHGAEGNIVNTFGVDMKTEWATMKAKCDHCGGKHNQKVTFIVRGEDGDEKQVGSTCLKDYCGINPQAAGIANELLELIEDDCAERYDFGLHCARIMTNLRDALAIAVKIQKENGYRSSSEPDSNKDKLRNIIAKGKTLPETDPCYETADQIIEIVKGMDIETAIGACLNNVKTLAACGYCDLVHFGYIAYAPLAVERYQKKLAERLAREQAKDQERKASEYVGEIKQTLTIDIKEFALLTSWDTRYGTTYLYKFVDVNDNVLIWKASGIFGEWIEEEKMVNGEKVIYKNEFKEHEECKKLRVTVKDHNERDGVKQTIVQKCKKIA